MDYIIKTEHYTFKLHVEDVYSPIHMRRFTIGDDKGLCLEASLLMPDVDERFAADIHICNIAQIHALGTCILEPAESDANIGQEILYAFINIINANYNHITHITLRDASYIPCNRTIGETLDLLSYNIAIYGKSWYEMKLGAYIDNQEEYVRYKEGLAQYTSIDVKRAVQWESFYANIAKANIFAAKTIGNNINLFRNIFETAKTWPECIETMKKHISKENKCKFFKSWLEKFIYSYVPEKRDWILSIEKNSVLKNVLNMSSAHPMRRTRRLKRARK
jgi:hypothetical protein